MHVVEQGEQGSSKGGTTMWAWKKNLLLSREVYPLFHQAPSQNNNIPKRAR